MKSIGVFQKGKINGKPFFISSQTYTPTSEITVDSEPLFLCPSLRYKAQELNKTEDDYSESFVPFDITPNFPNVDQRVQYLLDSDFHDDICKSTVVPLSLWNTEKPDDDFLPEIYCHACEKSSHGPMFYFCFSCSKHFHKECVEAPLEIKHPSYPFLSLQLYSPRISTSCICGERNLENIIYYCPTSNISMHPVCAMKPIPVVIDHPKRHPHPLTFFPKQAFLPCDVCGMIKESVPMYACVECVFVVHKDCIYFPYVIRISRHHHRISFTYSLPSGTWSCGVCRRKVDDHYGAYSCNKCDGYFVHSRCAVRRDLWNGKELEGVPEEPEIVIDPFKRIADGIILHFSHGHHLKLETSGVYDEYKFCQACIVPIYEGEYYSCMDKCDFILHEACANAPLKIYHGLFALPFMLTVEVGDEYYDFNKGQFQCKACLRRSCGFIYEDTLGSRLDVQCASISEPFKYQGHDHPLYLALSEEEEKSAICDICRLRGEGISSSYRILSCIECDFLLCFKCATLPYKAMYKHDKHLLTFYKKEEASAHSEWCDACERKIADSRKRGFYSCDDCCATLHIDCMLGTDPFMKPGETIEYDSKEYHILRNKTLSRPYCYKCYQRCQHKVVFKRNDRVFCSLYCAKNSSLFASSSSSHASSSPPPLLRFL